MANKSYQKRCKKCWSIEIKKDWFMRWKQRYKCKLCWYVFQNKTRVQNIENQEVSIYWQRPIVLTGSSY